ncbi:MAG: hypothetical protein KBG83_03640 [Bacteroidetes bacterium]|nr:hypothetical protein [Bacteroidota bacterium]
MDDFDEQRKKVEEIKKKILEQKKKSGAGESGTQSVVPVQQSNSIVEQSTPISKEPKAQEQATQQPAPHAQGAGIAKPQNESTNQQKPTSSTSIQVYLNTLYQALSDGVLSKDEEVLLATLRRSLGIREEDHYKMIKDIQREVYVQALREGWRDGKITEDDVEKLEKLREAFHISADEHLKLEKMVRQQLLRKG